MTAAKGGVTGVVPDAIIDEVVPTLVDVGSEATVVGDVGVEARCVPWAGVEQAVGATSPAIKTTTDSRRRTPEYYRQNDGVMRMTLSACGEPHH